MNKNNLDNKNIIKLSCKACGFKYKIDDNFCPNCAAKLKNEIIKDKFNFLENKDLILPNNEIKVCPTCSNQIDIKTYDYKLDNLNFCPNCGTNISLITKGKKIIDRRGLEGDIESLKKLIFKKKETEKTLSKEEYLKKKEFLKNELLYRYIYVFIVALFVLILLIKPKILTIFNFF